MKRWPVPNKNISLLSFDTTTNQKQQASGLQHWHTGSRGVIVTAPRTQPRVSGTDLCIFFLDFMMLLTKIPTHPIGSSNSIYLYITTKQESDSAQQYTRYTLEYYKHGTTYTGSGGQRHPSFCQDVAPPPSVFPMVSHDRRHTLSWSAGPPFHFQTYRYRLRLEIS